MPTPVNTLWCPKQSPNINLSAGLFFVLKPRNLSTFPSLSAGCPAVLTVPTLSLLFVLNKNSLPPEMIYVLKFFSNSCSDASKSLPSLGPFSWISFTICCPLPAQRRKVPSSWSSPLTSHAWSAGAPTVSGKAVFCVLERPLWCQVEETRGTHEVSCTSTATSTPLLTSSL